MTNERKEEIGQHAMKSADRVRSGWTVLCTAPDSYTQEEAKLWQERFERCMKGGE